MCVCEPVWSQDSKNVIFISVRGLEMLNIAVWKMTPATDSVFGYLFAKYRYINLKFGMADVQVWLYNLLFVFYFENFGF